MTCGGGKPNHNKTDNAMTTFVLNVTLSHAVRPGDRIVINVSDGCAQPDGSAAVACSGAAGGHAGTATDAAGCAPPTFFAFTEEIIGALDSDGHVRTAETYRCALNSFRRFRRGADIRIADLDAAIVAQYEQWLCADRRLTPNTVGFYMRKLRAVYNRAVDRSLTPDRRPFATAYTGHAKTRKRAVPVDGLRRLRAYQSSDPVERFALDMFFLSFYTRGMALVDLAYLRRDAVCGSSIVYVRRKTGQQLVVRRTPQIDAIMARYTSPSQVYALPIIQRADGSERTQFRTCQSTINRTLKAVGRRLGIEGLTLYAARHSWASMARQADVPMETISRCMGHTSERTTRIYIKEFDSDTLHTANTKVTGMLDT